MGELTYDSSQLAVIECEDQRVVGEAKAGAGKTTTAVGVALRRPEEQILYVCLNKSVQVEAQRRFPANVECRTTHSLAFSAVGRLYADRVTAKWGVRLLADQLDIRNSRVAATVRAALTEFFGSVAESPTAAHVEEVAHRWQLSESEQGQAVDHTRKAWREMQDTQSRLSLPHDAYLKMWALKKPQLRHSRIIIDEFQDTNPVTMQVVAAQNRAKILMLGDRHQSIYLFRGSINAMEEFSQSGATVLQMPRTWRFGDRTAHIANEVLSRMKGEETKIVGLGKDARMRQGSRYAFISRTNSVLFGVAVNQRGKGVHWSGGIENYRIDLILDAYRLFNNERGLIRDALLSRYDSWGQYRSEAEQTKDSEARILIKVVEEFGHEIPSLVDDLRKNEVRVEADADIVLTTGHKAKGLEYDYVRIGNDVECLFGAEAEIAEKGKLSPQTAQEINLLYVMITRARKYVTLNMETDAWLTSHGVVLPGT